ncbi:taste receptor type 2 member 8-like [Eublepharis macularius]|uniref:Taste receptor type 2 n=1 Tax=Eublepharis macularius TaxID=481883 RepID=A0AA97LJP9_EUBMA|nr:taste receptor type 2 member 8-like [Eublepharis macularius]
MGIFFLIVYEIESLLSLLGNGYIIVAIGHSWLFSRKMIPCDFLLTALSLSRFLLQWVSVSSQFAYFRSPETYLDSKTFLAFGFSWMYLNIASLWCATWLNVFYCVKVTNFAHPLFVWLKSRAGVLVPRFLGLSLLAFIICSIPPILIYFEEEKHHNLTGNLPENTSQIEAHGNDVFTFLHPLQNYFTAIGFSICLTASLLVLLSLWRHTRHLEKGRLGTKDFSTQAHLRVMKPLLLLLFFYILHFSAMMITLGNVFQYGKLERLISDIVLSSYPSIHSIIMIFTNPKLRELYIHVLNLGRSAS